MGYYILIFLFCCHIAWEQGVEDAIISYVALSCIFWFLRALYVDDKASGGPFWRR
ncbi:uncharacterized protein METZ01_LOCUS398716 [marine metagenome]|uniref:Uncharacterized protein n=1 Tax=marine metagenome TaxID=408172 RepID=A0A382VH52_9ZZZZ